MRTSNLFAKDLMDETFSKILGQVEAKTHLKSALMMDRHVILVGPPGVGKTSFAKHISTILKPIQAVNDAYHSDPQNPIAPETKVKKDNGEELEIIEVPGEKRFVRIQGSPDLTVEDLIGDIDPVKALEYGPMSIEAFTPGKIFKANRGLLFFDEVNRCPEKLQNALLQVLEEGRVTIGNYDVDIPVDFIFIGTMNPTDFSGTHSLSEVFLDRVDIINVNYPETVMIEQKILAENGVVLDGVNISDDITSSIVNFIQRLRVSDKLEKHPSVRATLGLFERAQSYAKLAGEKDVTMKHVEAVIPTVLEHRIKLKPSFKFLTKPKDFVKKEFDDFKKDNFSYAGVAPQRTSHNDDVP